MALINCPNCNGKASDKAEACPHCGSTALKNPIRIVCPECDSKIQGNPDSCPHCGFPMEQSSSHEINLPGGGSVSIPTHNEPIKMRGTPSPNNPPPPPPPPSDVAAFPPPPGDSFPSTPPTAMPFENAPMQLPHPSPNPNQLPHPSEGNPMEFNPPPPSMDLPSQIHDTNPPNPFHPNPGGIPQPVADYMLGLENNISGPHSLEEIQTWFQGGMLPPDTPCMAQGDPHWNTVAGVLGMPFQPEPPITPAAFPTQAYPAEADTNLLPDTKPVSLTVIGIIYIIASIGFGLLSILGLIPLAIQILSEKDIYWMVFITQGLQFAVSLIIAIGAARSGIDLVKSNPNENARTSGVNTSIALIVVCVALIGASFYLRSNNLSSPSAPPPLWPLIILFSLPIPFILTLTLLRRANVQHFCQSQK